MTGLRAWPVSGCAQQIEGHLSDIKGRAIPMNIDGATAIIYTKLGFDAPLARGLFCLSRSVGILAHAWDQTQQGDHNKGSLPKGHLWPHLKPNMRRSRKPSSPGIEDPLSVISAMGVKFDKGFNR